MNEVESILNLPEYIQVVIATGYIGHSIARAGLRDNERRDELLYGIIVYGLFGYISYDILRIHFTHFLVPAIFSTLVVVIIACLWRKFGKHLFGKIFHKAGVMNEDGTPNVWVGITQCTHSGPTQIKVLLKDGTSLICNDVQAFRDAPFPMYYTDNNGNIALYVTHIKKQNDVEKKFSSVRDKEWGDRLTYIPVAEIARVSIRFKKK